MPPPLLYLLSRLHASACQRAYSEPRGNVLAADSKGEKYPWPVASIDEMLGETLVSIEGKPPQHQTKKHKREDVLRKCQVLAIYFGGEWW